MQTFHLGVLPLRATHLARNKGRIDGQIRAPFILHENGMKTFSYETA